MYGRVPMRRGGHWALLAAVVITAAGAGCKQPTYSVLTDLPAPPRTLGPPTRTLQAPPEAPHGHARRDLRYEITLGIGGRNGDVIRRGAGEIEARFDFPVAGDRRRRSAAEDRRQDPCVARDRCRGEACSAGWHHWAPLRDP